jgi:hypothetical protein
MAIWRYGEFSDLAIGQLRHWPHRTLDLHGAAVVRGAHQFTESMSMRRVHPEFAFQSRELADQIEGILGDPPDRKNYQAMTQALVSEYAKGAGIEDLNMMAFALVDVIKFADPKVLLADAEDFEFGDPARVFGAVSCPEGAPAKMLAALEENHPDLGRQAIIAAFLHKHPRMWDDDDTSLDQLAEGDEGDDVDDDENLASDDFTQMFDQEGDR